MRSGRMNYVGTVVVLFLFWIAVSASFNWPELLVGLASAIFVVYFNRSLVITAADRPPIRMKTILWLVGYFFKLVRDILIANFQVAYLVLHPRMPICPTMVPMRVEIERVASRVLLGNSITLTPGTLTVLADEKDFLVHALTVENGEALKDWELIKRLKKMEEDGR